MVKSERQPKRCLSQIMEEFKPDEMANIVSSSFFAGETKMPKGV